MEFSPESLITFLHLAESRSFSEVARHLGIPQSTVSGHIAALERSLDAPLVRRRRGPGNPIELTPTGTEFAALSRPLSEAYSALRGHFSEPVDAGAVRIAIADDFAAHDAVGDALRTFRRRHSNVVVEVTVGQSGNLARRLRAGQFDLGLVKRLPDEGDAFVLRRERIVWTTHVQTREHPGFPLPLIAYPTSSFLRNLAIARLAEAGIPWRIANTVRGVNGALTAVRAELGVGIFAEEMLPADLVSAPAEWNLPPLGEVETVIARGSGLSQATLALAHTLEAWGTDLLHSRR
jgi:DNA-binding transcriptional LysR family regulator